MDSKNETTAKREPWLLVLMKGQILNKDAEALGKGPWSLFVGVILVTSVLAAFPFVNDKFTTAIRSTNPALYPGVTEVFDEMVAQNWDLSVSGGKLTAGPGVPAQAVVAGWRVVVEPAGGDSQALVQAVGDTTARPVAFFGATHLGFLIPATGSQFDGSWTKLEGFRLADLAKLKAAKALPMILYASASGDLVPSMAAIVLLMFVQVVFLTVILGFLLSLSKIQILGTHLGPKRAAGFLASLKTAGFVTLGPALILCVALSFLPGASGVSWVGFSLLFGGRIVLIYMARFRNKHKPV